jgi:hypothetical protein
VKLDFVRRGIPRKFIDINEIHVSFHRPKSQKIYKPAKILMTVTCSSIEQVRDGAKCLIN